MKLEEKEADSAALQDTPSGGLERERAERELKESNERIVSILESITDGFMAVDHNWRFTYVNRRCEEILRPLGKTRENLLGQVYWDAFPHNANNAIGQNLRRAMRDQVTAEFESLFAPLNAWFDVRAYPSPTGLSIYFQDITRRKRAEEVRSLLAAVVESSDDAIISSTLEGTITSWNKAAERMYGYSPEEIIGKPLSVLIPPERWGEELEILKKLKNGDRVQHYETIRVHKDGTLLEVSLSLSPIRDASGNILGASKISRDITQSKLAERTLKHSEEQLRLVTDAAPALISYLDSDCRYRFVNLQYETWFDCKRKDILGKRMDEVLGAKAVATLKPFLDRAYKGEKVRFELEVPYRQGGTRSIDAFYIPDFDEKRQVRGIYVLVVDLTERKRAEQALRESEARFRQLADAMPQIVWTARADGFVDYYNQRWFDYTGLPEGKGGDPSWAPAISPEDLQRSHDVWYESVRSGKPYELEFRLKDRDGYYRWHLARALPVRNEAGQIVRWFGSATDIDDRKRTEQALLDESSVLELLNETGRAIAAQLDLQSLVQVVTAAATKLSGAEFGAFLYSGGESHGEGGRLYTFSDAAREAFEKLGYPRSTSVFKPTFEGEAVVRSADITEDSRYQEMVRHNAGPSGPPPVRSYLAVPVISRSGQVIAALLFAHPERDVFTERAERLVVGVAAQAATAIDNAQLYEAAQNEITERTRAEGALKKAQEQLTRHTEELELQVAERTAHLRESIQSLEGVCYTIAHDLRAPLRAVQGFTKVLLDDYAPAFDAEGQRLANRIVSAAIKMDFLIRDLLDYARLSHADLPCTNIDLDPLVQRVLQNLSHEVTASAATVEVEPLPSVWGNPTIVDQIFTNLLSNSLKFVEPGRTPKIQIRGDSSQGGVRVFIKDNGIGIAPEHRERVFGMFQRLHSDEKKYPGTGVGLAIVRKGIERIGGWVGILPDEPPGTCFYLDFLSAKAE